MNFKKYTALLLALLLTLSLGACGGDAELGEPVEDPEVSADTESESQQPEAGETPEDPAPVEEPADDGEAPEAGETEDPAEQPVEGEASPSDGEEEVTTPSQPPAAENNGDTPEQKPAEEVPVEPEEPSKAEPDANGMIALKDNMFLEAPKAYSADSVGKLANKLNAMKETYMAGARSFAYAVIPDKSHYAGDQTDHVLDHDKMVADLAGKMSGWSEIALGDLLTLDDYYKTDAHWRQEEILPVAQRIAKKLGFTVSSGSFSQSTQAGFVGDYKRHIGSAVTETIVWMESAATKAATADNFQRPGSTAVYDPALLSTNSPYDLYLGGPTPLVTVTNPNNTTGARLILFRDSFGSSLAPLLLEGYSEIQLVDTRYMSSQLLPQYVDFTDADVLCVYSAALVNNSSLLR